MFSVITNIYNKKIKGPNLTEFFSHRITDFFFLTTIDVRNGFGGLGVACWSLVPKFEGSNPAGFKGEKILSTPSFGGEVKPSVPCRRFAECKRSLNLSGSRNLGKITTGNLSRPQFHLSLLGSLTSLRTEAPGG